MFAPPIAKTKAKTTSTTVSTHAPKTGHQIPGRPTGSVAEQVLALERTIGNQATLRLLAQRSSRRSGTGPGDQYEQTGRTVRMPEPQLHIQPGAPSIQPKLVVGEVNDPLEHEADRVADQLTRMPAPQRSITTGPPQLNCKCAACEDEKLLTLQTKPVGSRQAAAGEAPGIVHEVRRSPGRSLDPGACTSMETRFGHGFGGLRMHPDKNAAAPAASALRSGPGSSRSPRPSARSVSQAEPFADRPGRAIEPARRSDLERSLGIDLSSVRLHTGHAAAQGAHAFGARAYTLGSDVFFAAGQYRPDTEAGRWLLAHELAHVAQSAALRGSNGQTAGATLRRSPEPGAGPAESPALGLPPPDCATRVNDVFVLGTVYENRAHPECSFAQIHERKNMSRVFSYRADLPLSATPCERGDVRSHEYWLGGDRWRILEVHGTEVLVMNACGEEEVLSKSNAPLCHWAGPRAPDRS